MIIRIHFVTWQKDKGVANAVTKRFYRLLFVLFIPVLLDNYKTEYIMVHGEDTFLKGVK